MLRNLIQVLSLVFLVSLPAMPTTSNLVVPNGGFENVNAKTGLPDRWHIGFGKTTKATIELDEMVVHSGRRSLRLTDATPNAPYNFGQAASQQLAVKPSTTYLVQFFTKGKNVSKCYVGVNFEGTGGQSRQTVPAGTYDWQEQTFRFTTPLDCKSISVHFATDDVTDALWVDDVTLALSSHQLANLAERRYLKDFPGMFPRTLGSVPEHLLVVDATQSADATMLLAALQGIVNRKGPRLYLLNRTDPHNQDEVWLRYMQEKGYTGHEERLDGYKAAIQRFRDEITGVIIYDPQLPGSLNAAWMLAGLKNALPASPQTAAKLGLPVVEDLRGRTGEGSS